MFKMFKTSGYEVKDLYFQRAFSDLVENRRGKVYEREASKPVELQSISYLTTLRFRPDSHLSPLLAKILNSKY